MQVYVDSNSLIIVLIQQLRYSKTNFSLYMGMPEYETLLTTINTIFGSNYEEHNKASRACLLRLETHGLTLNMGKCKFLKQNLEFLGMIFSTEDVCPDPKKISVFVNTTTPVWPTTAHSLFKIFATITEPLRRLTHKGGNQSMRKPIRK